MKWTARPIPFFIDDGKTWTTAEDAFGLSIEGASDIPRWGLFKDDVLVAMLSDEMTLTEVQTILDALHIKGTIHENALH